jgi:hypothetical protein
VYTFSKKITKATLFKGCLAENPASAGVKKQQWLISSSCDGSYEDAFCVCA